VGPGIDGPWETYPGNPVIMDVANNWGIGHGDLVIAGPATYLYTATSQTTRGRYVLVRR
jgi:beta-xylosidase